METNYTLKKLIRSGTFLLFFFASLLTVPQSLEAQNRATTDLVVIIEGAAGSKVHVTWPGGSGTIVGPVTGSTIKDVPVSSIVTFKVIPPESACIEFLEWEDVNIGKPVPTGDPDEYEIALLESLIDGLQPGERPKVKAVFDDYSTYEFSVDLDQPVCSETDVDLDLNFKTVELKQCGYDNVRFAIKAEGPGNVTFEEDDGTDFVNSGYYPGPGFDLPADYDETTNWTLNFSESGDYTITFSLVNVSDDAVIANTMQTFNISVNPEPVVGFSFNGELAVTDSEFVYCYDELITVTLSHIYIGEAPFEIEWTVDGTPFSNDNVALNGELFTDKKDPGTYVVEITSIIDANGCEVKDVAPYRATVIVKDEAAVGFSFNGVLAGTEDVFTYCHNDIVAVTLSHVWEGEAPFDIEWTVNGDPYAKAGVDLGGELFSGVKDPGSYDIVITSITGDDNCSVVDLVPYKATVIVKPEIAVGFSFNGDLADTDDVFEYCNNEIVSVTLSNVWEGTAPFDITWEVNGVEASETGVEIGDVLFSDPLAPGTYVVQITEIVGADDCEVIDLTPYTATVIVHTEPVVGFSFNGDLADTDDTFVYCYNENVSVTLSHVWEGTAPFDIEWTVNGVAGSKNAVELDDELFSDVKDPGTYDIVITSIRDANGCEVADVSPYQATVIVKPEIAVGFSFDGTLADTGDEFNYCIDQFVSVTLSDVWEGTAPFDITWEVNGVEASETGVEIGDVLFSDLLAPGTYVVQITEIVGADNCEVIDLTPYTATVIVQPEPVVGFSFNGDLAGTDDEFDYCYDEEITVTLSHVLAGIAPFDIEWTVNGVAGSKNAVALDGELFSGVKDPGTYDIVITSITDANGCEVADVSPYQATVIVKPEIAIGFSFDGTLADTDDVFEYCYNETVSVTLSHIWVGNAPFDITWEVNGVEESATAVDINDVLFSGQMNPGTYEIEITEIVDADGCKAVNLTPYVATVVVNPEPVVGFSFNGTLADTDDVFELCYDEALTVTLSHVWAGEAPFDLEWTVNGEHFDQTGVVQGGTLFSGIQDPGTYVIQITSIVDAKGCVADDTTPYTATVVVHPMPVVGFSFNGDLADTGDVFSYCFDEEIVVTLSHVWEGTAPFDIQWTVNGVAYDETDVAEGGTLFSGLRDPGTYNIVITAITDDNGCVVDDVTPYQATVVVYPEPVAVITGNPVDDICSDVDVVLDLVFDPLIFGATYTVTWFVNGEEALEADSETAFTFNVEDFVTDPAVSQDVTVYAHIINEWGCESTTDDVSIHVIGRPIITNNAIVTPEINVYCSAIPAGIIIQGDGEVEWDEMPTHEDCSPVFQWYSSTNDGASWSKLGGESTLAFYQMPQLPQTTWYQRWVTLENCVCELYPEEWHKSNIVKMSVIQPFGVAEITDTDPDPLCIDSQITLTGNAVPADIADWVTGEWSYTGPGVISFDPDQFDPQAIVTADQGGVYNLTWSWDVADNVDEDCGTDSEAQMTIIFDEIISVDDLAPIAPLCYNAAPVTLDAPDYDVIGSIESKEFSGDGVALVGDDYMFDATLVVPGDHVITFTLTTEGGCIETRIITVTVNEEPLLGFSFNGELAATDSEFIYCYDTPVTVTLSHVWAGAGPFDIVYKVNDDEFTAVNVEQGDVLFDEPLAAGVYNIEIVSIVDANGCTPTAIGDYQASVVINEEPLLGFSFNGVLADTDSEFVYCNNTGVSVTLSHVWAGAGPFDIVYKVNDDEFTANVEQGDVLFDDLLPAGEYNIEIISIVDANGCTPSSIGDYTAKVIIYAEPIVGFSFNDVLAGANDVFEYCHNTEVTVTLSHVWAGNAPFDLAWTVNGVAYSASGVQPGDVLFSDFLVADDYEVVITSIVDANNCVPLDLSDYTATITIHEEPIIGFAFNGIPAPHNAVFEFCEEVGVEVKLDAIYGGLAPFAVTYQINDEAPVVITGLDEGDVIYNENPAAGLHTVKVLEIVDANGCVAGDDFLDLLVAEVTILEAPYVDIAFDGEVAGYDASFTYSYNEPVSVTLANVVSGMAPFDFEWTVTDLDGVVTTGEATGLEEGDVLFASDGLEPGVYSVQLTSVTDANGCSIADLTGFAATITVLKVAELDEDDIYSTARTVYTFWDEEIYDTWQVMVSEDTKGSGVWITVNDPFILLDDLEPDTDYVIWLRTLEAGEVVGDVSMANFSTLAAGDVDGIDGVTITDITLIVDKISNNLGARVVVSDAEELAAEDGGPVFIFDAADMNNDGIIDIFDIVRAVNVLFPPDTDKMNDSQSADIFLTPDAIRLNSDGTLVALQFELTGDNLADVTLDVKVPGLEIVWTIEGNTLTAYVFSLNNQLIAAGANMLIDVANGANLEWGKVFASNLSAEKVKVNTHHDIPTDIFDDFNTGLSLDVYPNPSQGDFTSRVDLPVNAIVTFVLYDLGGRQVAYKQVNASAGTENVAWNVDLNPGMYVLRMVAKPLDRNDRFTREMRVIIN